jgi:calcium/calmodulin-dependent protein kinase I
MWSLGVIAYFMLYGQPPFHAESDAKLFDLIISGQFDFPKSTMVSEDAKDFVRGLLIVDYMHKDG